MPNEYYVRTKSSGNFATNGLVHEGFCRFLGGTFNSNCSAASHVVVYDSDGVTPQDNANTIAGFYFPPGGGCESISLPNIDWAVDILNGIYVKFNGTGTNAVVWYSEPLSEHLAP
jgi:hypothetical protein